MARILLTMMFAFAAAVQAAEEPADADVADSATEEQTLEEATAEAAEESEPPKSRIRRPRKLGDIFKPSEEITADSAISFPADI